MGGWLEFYGFGVNYIDMLLSTPENTINLPGAFNGQPCDTKQTYLALI